MHHQLVPETATLRLSNHEWLSLKSLLFSYRIECQRRFELQNRALSSDEPVASDVDDGDDEDDDGEDAKDGELHCHVFGLLHSGIYF